MTVLTLIWWTAVTGGFAACLLALTVRSHRHELLLLAGVCFLIAGVLGILSIGLIFLVASAACIIAASRNEVQPS
jgi:hypothetical protein